MRSLKYFVVIPALALLVMSCGPHHRRCGGMDGPPCKGGKHAMMHHHGGGAGACSYKSHWFSEGAVRSNDGVCQSCSAGKWVAATGCHDHGCGDCHDCGGKKGKKSGPCHHHGGKGGGPGHRH